MWRHEFWLGTKYSLPIAIGYFPLGFAFGVMGREAGLTVLDIVLMSTLVFAGAAQFIAVGLIAAGVEAGAILITTFLVNIRHLLMSTALQPYFKGHSRANLGLIAFQITDETFVVGSNYHATQKPSQFFQLGLNMASHATWILSSWLGAGMGILVAQPEKLGLTFALPAMFIALLVGQIKNRAAIAAAVTAGAISLLSGIIFKGNWHIILRPYCRNIGGAG